MSRNLPNLLSALRIALTPFVALAIIQGRSVLALVLLGAAGLSDLADGWLARRMGVSSRLGAYLDPVSDKLLLVTVYFCEGWAGYLPAWLVAMVFGRDLLILAAAGWAMLFTRLRRFPPSIWGKLSTLVQIAVALLVLADQGRVVDRGLVLASAAVTTGWSALHYFWRGVNALRTGRIDGGPDRG